LLNEIKEATVSGNREKVLTLIDQACAQGIKPETIIEKSLIDAMTIVGERFKTNEIYVPEMLIAARAMKAGLEKLKPMLIGGDLRFITKVVIGTVRGDLHDIGKNLVCIMMEGAGIEVHDLGVDIGPEKFVEAVANHKPRFIGLSALLTTTMPVMKDTIRALEVAGLREKVKVLIGGAPITQKYADEIGADGYAANAAEGVEIIKKFL